MDGTVRAIAGGLELRFERRFSHPVEQVWAALTQPDKLVDWLAQAEVDLTPGGRVQLRWLNTDEQGNTAVAQGTVTAFDPPRLVEYDTDIHGRLRWELRPEGSGCLLVFTVSFFGPEEYLSKLLAGWHIHLDHLEDALKGQKVDWPNWMARHFGRWSEYNDRYAAMLRSR